jgi:hypothetical protein
MKTFCKLLASAFMMLMLAAQALAQGPAPQVVLSNVTEGVGSITGANQNWAGFSELVLIPGASFLGVKTSTNFLYLGFTGGTTVDIGNMVLYKTARSGNINLGPKKVLLGGVSNPSVNLTHTAVCPIQPVSTTNPCFIKLDVIKGALSPLFDYTFVVYFTNDANNASVGAAQSSEQGALSGYFLTGDQTRIKKNGTVPSGNNGSAPFFVTYMTNQ